MSNVCHINCGKENEARVTHLLTQCTIVTFSIMSDSLPALSLSLSLSHSLSLSPPHTHTHKQCTSDEVKTQGEVCSFRLSRLRRPIGACVC